MRTILKMMMTCVLIIACMIANAQTNQTQVKQIPGTQKEHEEMPLNAALPPFHFVTHNEVFITEADIPKHKPIVLTLFNPNCDHCLQAAVLIKENMEAFRNVTIIFVTSILNFGELKGFAQISELAKYPNVYVCATQDEYISKTFMPNWILPQVQLYNVNRKLKKTYYETIQTDSLINYLYK